MVMLAQPSPVGRVGAGIFKPQAVCLAEVSCVLFSKA